MFPPDLLHTTHPNVVCDGRMKHRLYLRLDCYSSIVTARLVRLRHFSLSRSGLYINLLSLFEVTSPIRVTAHERLKQPSMCIVVLDLPFTVEHDPCTCWISGGFGGGSVYLPCPLAPKWPYYAEWAVVATSDRYFRLLEAKWQNLRGLRPLLCHGQ